MQDFSRCTSFWTYLRFFAAIFLLDICKKRINCVSTIDMNTSPTQISENIKTHGRDFANIFPYLMSPTSINHIFLLPGDVNHLCDIEHLDAVVDERLGITGQLGVQEKN